MNIDRGWRRHCAKCARFGVDPNDCWDEEPHDEDDEAEERDLDLADEKARLLEKTRRWR